MNDFIRKELCLDIFPKEIADELVVGIRNMVIEEMQNNGN